MITGYATPEGTKKFAEKQNENTQKNYKIFKILHYLMLELVHILEIQTLKQTT